MDFGAPIFMGAGLIAFGDSFTTGTGASDLPHAYISRLISYIGGSLNNQAVSGMGSTVAAQAALAILPNNRKQAVSVLAGFNDISAGAAAIPKIKSNLRALIAGALLRDSVPASALGAAGTWSAMAPTYGGRAFAIGGTGMFTDDPAAYLQWDFFGETLVVGAFSTYPSAYRWVLVSIDGGAQQLLQTTAINVNEPYSYTALVLKNLGFEKHTVKLSVADPSYHTVIDYLGTLADPAVAQAVLVGEIPTRTNWTHAAVTINQEIVDAANRDLAAVVAEFAEWPVQYVPIGDFYPSAHVGPDGYHPSDTGHFDIYSAFRSQISLHW